MGKKSEEKLRLTPLGCLYAVLKNYAGEDGMLNVNKIQGRYGEHIMDDLFDALERQGYLRRGNDDERESE